MIYFLSFVWATAPFFGAIISSSDYYEDVYGLLGFLLTADGLTAGFVSTLAPFLATGFSTLLSSEDSSLAALTPFLGWFWTFFGF